MEKAVISTIKGCLTNLKSLREIANIQGDDDKTINFIKDNVDNVFIVEIIKLSMIKGEVHPDTLEIHLSKPVLISLLSEKLKINLPEPIDKIHIESIPFRTRRGDRVMIVTTPSGKHDPFDRTPIELKNWVRGIVWRDEFYSGLRIEQIAKRENLSARYVGRLIDASLEVHNA